MVNPTMKEREIYTEAKLVDMLHKAGVRPSVQRIAIMSHIANLRKHPTVDEIYNDLKESYPSMSRTTVYNSVHALVDARLVRELEIESGNMHYDLAPQPHHSHFMCRRCHRIFDMAMPVIMPGEEASGFSIDTVDLYYKGLCPECNQK